ncbi:MAG TPA: nucleotidyltransferase family protein [Pyrinomonadaceae bacterium]|nr:nucleotidyltransferase family protein [Pyrinomonadaceae bacterium]
MSRATNRHENRGIAEHEREHELLLCCARTDSAPAVVQRMRELAASVQLDWDYLFQLARRHAVIPLLYLQLAREAADLVPSSNLAKLKRQYQENNARNLILTDELRRLIDFFNDAGIEAIPYKGPALALFAYGNLALRRFVDLDVIVRKSDVLRARDLLLAEGYTPTKSLTPAQQELLLRTQHNLQLARDNGRLILELHWEVAPHLFASSVQENELWRNLTTIELNGTRMKTLGADDLLFSLCVHGSRHLWERLGWICDIAELIGHHDLNWPGLLERARQTDAERMFLLGLHLARKLLQAQLPAAVQQRCDSDPRLESLAANVIEHLFNGPTHIPATSTEIFKYNISVRKSLAARARYFVYMLRPTDSDFGTRSLPAAFSFGYYLVRPFRLLFRTKTTST